MVSESRELGPVPFALIHIILRKEFRHNGWTLLSKREAGTFSSVGIYVI